MRIGLYGSIADRLGRELTFEAAGLASVGALRRALAAAFPAAAEALVAPGLKAFVDDRMVGDEAPLDGVEAVEFLPPLSGG